MSVILGQGEYRYRVEEGWGKLPDGWSFHEVGAVGVDRNDNVYVFHRGEHPMIVFDRDGNFLRSWGEGMFPRPMACTWHPTTRSSAPTTAPIACGNARSTARC